MVSVLSEMEEQLPFGIKYIQCGKTDSILYSTVKDIPDLGTLKEKHSEISFLIIQRRRNWSDPWYVCNCGR